MTTYLVWGMGEWQRRGEVSNDDLFAVNPGVQPEYDLLPKAFRDGWEMELAAAQDCVQERWAEIVTADENTMDTVTRYDANVLGYLPVGGEQWAVGG